jgi:F-type H+-transporting ATPase subunit b
VHFDWSTFLLQTINFAVLVWLLHRFLYKPVLRLVDARRAEIDKQYAEAHVSEAHAKGQLAAVAVARAGIAAERRAALKEAAGQAEQTAAARHAEAEREATELLTDARKTLAAERGQALTEARRLAVDLAADIAQRLLGELPAASRCEGWCDRIGQYLSEMPQAERDGLVRQLTDGTRVDVVTAQALSLDSAQAWRKQLQRALGAAAPVEFVVDPALIAGADLHFPNAILHFSWAGALAAMRKEIEADGNAH